MDQLAQALWDAIQKFKPKLVVTLPELIEAEKLDPELKDKVIAGLKTLQEHGFGRFVLGRKGYPTRFECHEDSPDPEVAEPTPPEEAPSIPEAVAKDPNPVPEELAPLGLNFKPLTQGYVVQMIPLRKDFCLRLALPRDMTEVERSRLISYLKELNIQAYKERPSGTEILTRIHDEKGKDILNPS